MQPLRTSPLRLRRAALLASLSTGVLACFQDAQGPRVPAPGVFAFQPIFSALGEGAVQAVPIARARIVLLRPGTTTIALDTVIEYPAGADSLVVALPVPLIGITATEHFDLNLALVGPAGDTVFRAGPTLVPVTIPGGGAPPAPVAVGVRYVGTGSNAARLRLTVRDTAFRFGDTLTLATTVFDSSNVLLPGTPVVFESLDTNRVRVPRGTGFLIAKPLRGTVRVIAKTLTGQADTATLTVRPVPSSVELVSGNAQTGEVDVTLAAPMVVRVMAADGAPVPGATVKFFTNTGSGSVPDSVTTADALGIARSPWKLGTVAGAMSARAEVSAPRAPVTGSPLAFSATATHGAPSKVEFTAAPPATNIAGAVFAPSVAVTVRDRFNNVATSFADTVAVKLANASLPAGPVPLDSLLTGPHRVKAVSGVATFAGLAVKKAAAGFTLVTGVPSRGTIPLVSSSAFAVTPAGAAKLVYSQTPTGPMTAGVAATPAPVVAVTDAFENVVTTFSGTVTLALEANPAGGALAGTTSVSAAAGLATFPDLRIEKAGTGYTVRASSGTLTSVVSGAFHVQPASAAKLAFTSPPGSVAAGASLGSVVVTVQDAFGNAVLAHTGDIAIAFGTNPTSAPLLGTATQAVAGNTATFAGLSVQKAGAGYTLAATSGALTPATSPPFTIVPGPVAALAFVAAPSSAVAGAAFAPAVQVQATDAFGNVVTSFADPVVIDFAVNPGGATLAGTASVPSAAGVATFSTLSLNRPGSGYVLRATSGSLTVNSGAFTASAGPAASLEFSAQPPSAIGGGAPFPSAVVVTAKDASGNVAADFAGAVTLSLGSNEEGRALSGTTSVVAGSGVASFPGLSISGPGTFHLAAAAAGVAGAISTDIVVSSSTPSSIIALEPVVQFGAPGTVLSSPLRVRVLDASAAPMPGITVSFAIATSADFGGGEAGGGFVENGSLSAASVVTDAAGEAQVTLTLGTTVGLNVVLAGVAGVSAPVTFLGLGVGAEGARVWTGSHPSDGTNWHNPDNWSPVGVPSDTDNVIVSVFGPNAPVLTAPAAVRHLTISSGSLQLSTFALEVKGNLVVAGDEATLLSTSGTLLLSGTEGFVSGSGLPSTTITGTYALVDEATFSGNLTVSGATASLDVAGDFAQVDGNLLVTSGGLLLMRSSAADLNVLGSATFAGRHMADTSLTAGDLRVGGAFTVECADAGAASFRANGTHQVILNGTAGPQTLSMLCDGTGPTDDQLNELEVDNPAGVTSVSSIVVRDQVDLRAGSLTAPQVYVRRISDPSGGSRWLVPDTRIRAFGGTTAVLPATATTDVTFEEGRLVLSGRPTVNGRVFVNGSTTSLELTFTHLSVTGDFSVGSSGRVVMRNLSDSLTVGGNATFAGRAMGDTLLTAGVLRLRGNFTSTLSDNFRAGPAHLTIFEGGTAQQITMFLAGLNSGSGSFGSVRIDNPAGVVMAGNDVAARGAVHLAAGTVTATGLSDTFILADSLVDPAGNFQPKSVRFAKTGMLRMPATFNTFVEVSGDATLSTGFTVAGGRNLRVNNSGKLRMNGQTVAVTGTFRVDPSSYLFMNNLADQLNVTDSVIFTGAGMGDSTLTAGVIRVGRKFRNNSPGNFTASGTHTVIFTGAASKPVELSTGGAGPTQTHFQNVEIAGGGVNFATDAHVNGRVLISTGTVASSAGRTVTIADELDDATGGRWQVTNTILTKSGTFPVPSTVASNLTFTGNAVLSNGFTVSGGRTLTVGANGTLNLNGKTVSVTGNFSTTGGYTSGGRLRMNNAADVLDVTGTISFGGGNLGDGGTFLTDGTIIARGASWTNDNFDNFHATGAHKVVFQGTAAQTVAMNNSGTAATSSRFSNVEFNNPAGVSFPTSNGYIGGTALITTGNVTSTGGRTVTLADVLTDAVGGRWQVENTTMSKAGTYALPATLATNVTFTGNMAPANGFTVTGGRSLIIGSGGTMNLNGQTVVATGAFSTTGGYSSGGRLKMINAADVLDVSGNISFGGGNLGDGSSHLTDGTIIARGGTFSNDNFDNFQAAFAHKVIFRGAAAQVITLNNSGTASTSARFANVEIDNTAGVNWTSNGHVNGPVLITAGNVTSTGGRTITLADVLTDATGGRWQTENTVFSKSGAFSVPALMATNLTFTGNAAILNGFTVTGGRALIVGSGGTLNLSGRTVVATGSFSTTGGYASGGRLRMTDPADVLDVTGTITFNGGNLGDGGAYLTNGHIIARGASFSNDNFDNFQSQGSHKVTFQGVAAQTIAMNNSGAAPTSARFNLVEVNNAAGVSFPTTNGYFGGNVLITNGTVSTAAGRTLTVADLILDAVGGRWQADNTIASKSGTFAFPATLPTNLTITGNVTLASPFTITSGRALEIGSGGTLNLNNNTVTVTGNFETSGGYASGGRLRMNNALDVLDVTGTIVFDGGNLGDGGGYLTNGLIRARGSSFSNTNFDNFHATGSHKVVFQGTAAQTVAMNNSGAAPSNSRFHLVEINNASGVNWPTTNGYIGGDVLITAGVVTSSGGRTVTLAEVLTDAVGNRWMVENTVMSKSGTFAVPTFLQTNVTFTGAATMSNAFTVTGGRSLIVGTGGTFDPNGRTIGVTGNFSTTGGATSGGRLKMTSTLDTLAIGGNATFSGGALGGGSPLITAGGILVNGNFSNDSFDNFQANGTNTVVLQGSGAQTVSLNNTGSGTSSSHFANLEISNSSGAGVTLGSDLYATGRLKTTAGATTTRTLTSTNRELKVRGLDADGLKWVNTKLHVDTWAAGFVRFDNANWASTTTDATGFDYITIRASTAFDFSFGGIVVPTNPNLSKWIVVDGITGGATLRRITVSGTPLFPDSDPDDEIPGINGGTVCWNC